MCGIAGIAGQPDAEAARRAVDEMTRSLAHRGPDASGTAVGEGFALGHRRLSIIDLSEAANQPMADGEDRYLLVFNGEVYNYREVRENLPDYPFRTDSDSETILAAYRTYGPGCLPMLNGMFAFAIWDRVGRKLFLARDRLGVKPLYYTLNGPVLAFASEVRALLAAGCARPRIDRRSLSDYVLYQSACSPATIVEDVRQLPPGSFAEFSDGRLKVESYWSPETHVRPADPDPAAVRSEVRRLLLDSVRLRLVSDVRLGAFLSGGIDSSAIVGLMAEISDSPVETFSVVFDEPEWDESRFSSAIARRFRTRHTAVRLNAASFLEGLPEALAAADSPSGDGINTFVVSKATRDAGIKVALSGIGGDELFAGYPNFLNWYRLRRGPVSKLPGAVARPLGAALAATGRSKLQRLGAALASDRTIASVYPATRQVISRQSLAGLLPGSRSGDSVAEGLAARAEAVGRLPLFSQFSVAELSAYTLNVLLKDADQFSMASALEIREPFFDYRLVEYVLGIPDDVKYPDYPKRLLVESVAPLLPDEIVRRPKMGFVLPWERWMRSELREFCGERIGRLAERGLFDPGELLRRWRVFGEGGGGVLWSQVWHLVVLEDWLGRHGF